MEEEAKRCSWKLIGQKFERWPRKLHFGSYCFKAKISRQGELCLFLKLVIFQRCGSSCAVNPSAPSFQSLEDFCKQNPCVRPSLTMTLLRQVLASTCFDLGPQIARSALGASPSAFGRTRAELISTQGPEVLARLGCAFRVWCVRDEGWPSDLPLPKVTEVGSRVGFWEEF